MKMGNRTERENVKVKVKMKGKLQTRGEERPMLCPRGK
jgi:hypothetical protein